ncbi:hypothetical protein EHQ27_07140 [Leptospira wolffii]|nr:hypothetical protein [Leptospira wolffii]TGK56208.1 hypothetical protein EHQ32_17505 [Leptospira wolffii]TGK72255.1 hypothetical protein EHQ35_12940 [Leptospira wolffii]TGK72839.1 hypothetical protein EHQ27_07140 [Leptospira wolffii]TGL27832.1 hypothetical protein EHQ57_15765 [Leptospira wolffii]
MKIAKIYYILLILIASLSLPILGQSVNGPGSVEVQSQEEQNEEKEKRKKADRRVDQRKGLWSFQWGYNRDSYTQSDINFRGPGYHFTLKDVVARDKPEPFKGDVYFNPSLWEIPQYNIKFTYYIKDNLFITFGQDHMKYVMSKGQAANISGYIDPLAIAAARYATSFESAPYLYLFPEHLNQFAGYHGGETINITPDFLKFEHTDGLNYLFVDVGYVAPLWISQSGENALSLVGSVGGGPVICRSDVRLFGQGKNNHFHLSGYGVSGYSALRLDMLKSFFFEFGAKGGYIDLTNILTNGKSKDRATQNFGFVEMIVSAGLMF